MAPETANYAYSPIDGKSMTRGLIVLSGHPFIDCLSTTRVYSAATLGKRTQCITFQSRLRD